MDESINRYFHTLTDHAAVWWLQVYPIISSAEAVRLYVLVALFLLIATAARGGYIAKRKLTKLEREALNVKFPGPDPHKENSKDKRKAALDARAAEKLEPFWCALWKLLGAGLAVPTIIFVLVTMNYSWFDPTGLPFLSLMDKLPLRTVNDETITYFMLNQFSHGALFDFLEVFDINMVTVANNPDNYWFSGIVLLYRTLISAFIVALAIGWVQLLLVKSSFKKKIKEEMERFDSDAPTAEDVPAMRASPT